MALDSFSWKKFPIWLSWLTSSTFNNSMPNKLSVISWQSLFFSSCKNQQKWQKWQTRKRLDWWTILMTVHWNYWMSEASNVLWAKIIALPGSPQAFLDVRARWKRVCLVLLPSFSILTHSVFCPRWIKDLTQKNNCFYKFGKSNIRYICVTKNVLVVISVF